MLYKSKKLKNVYVKNRYGKRPTLWKKQKTVSERKLGQILNRRGINKVEAIKRKGNRFEIFYPYKLTRKDIRRVRK